VGITAQKANWGTCRRGRKTSEESGGDAKTTKKRETHLPLERKKKRNRKTEEKAGSGKSPRRSGSCNQQRSTRERQQGVNGLDNNQEELIRVGNAGAQVVRKKKKNWQKTHGELNGD